MTKPTRIFNALACCAVLGVSSLAGATAFAPMGTPFLRQASNGKFYNSQTGRQTNVFNGAPQGPAVRYPVAPVQTQLVSATAHPAPASQALHVGVNIVEK
jgi:hypothetical protein